MSWKNRIGIAHLHPMYTEPVIEEHEIDECDRCHNDGEHSNPLNWYDVCDGCAADLAEQTEHMTYEFKFEVNDVKLAEAWARANGYKYDDVNHLLHDAMTAGAIKPRGWKAA